MAGVDQRIRKLEEQLASVYSDPKEAAGHEFRRRLLESYTLIELNVMSEVNGLHLSNPDLSPAEVYPLMTDTQRLWPNYHFGRVKDILKEMLDEEGISASPEARRELREMYTATLGSFDFYKNLVAEHDPDGGDIR